MGLRFFASVIGIVVVLFGFQTRSSAGEGGGQTCGQWLRVYASRGMSQLANAPFFHGFGWAAFDQISRAQIKETLNTSALLEAASTLQVSKGSPEDQEGLEKASLRVGRFFKKYFPKGGGPSSQTLEQVTAWLNEFNWAASSSECLSLCAKNGVGVCPRRILALRALKQDSIIEEKNKQLDDRTVEVKTSGDSDQIVLKWVGEGKTDERGILFFEIFL